MDQEHQLLWQDPADKPSPFKYVHRETKVTGDLVNPQHYQGAGMQVIDVLRAFLSAEEFKGYLKGNILKYQLRCEKKGGVTDLHKSSWYCEELKKILNGSHST